MAFSWLTNKKSPSYTPAAQARAVWGRPRTFEAIAIHWWGSPATNPTFEGVVDYLCRAATQVSAHIVATGTGRRAANIVPLADASWATNSANPYTISIECDPRCRPEDYDTVAEIIAQIRSKYGNLPLLPHKAVVATACPGNYDLNKLNQIAATKKASSAWGSVTSKDEEVKIGSEANWRWRFNRLHHQLVGNWDMSDAVFKSIVGQDAWKVVENWSSHENSDKTMEYQKVGQLAVDHAWQSQIYKLQDHNKALAAENEQLRKENATRPPQSGSDGSFTESDRNTLNGIKNVTDSIWKALKAIFNIKE